MEDLMKLREDAHALLGRRIVRGILPGLDTGCLVSWAQKRLTYGHATPSIKLLADPAAIRREHRERVFMQCLEELDIAIEHGEIELVHAFIKKLANAVYKKRIQPGLSLQIMQDVITRFDWR